MHIEESIFEGLRHGWYQDIKADLKRSFSSCFKKQYIHSIYKCKDSKRIHRGAIGR